MFEHGMLPLYPLSSQDAFFKIVAVEEREILKVD
jgi:hypothetical protein